MAEKTVNAPSEGPAEDLDRQAAEEAAALLAAQQGQVPRGP